MTASASGAPDFSNSAAQFNRSGYCSSGRSKRNSGSSSGGGSRSRTKLSYISVRHHRRRLDLDLRRALDESLHLDQRHGRIIAAHDLAPGGADLVALARIFAAVDHVAGHSDDMLRPGAVLGKDCEGVAERLGELAVERIFAEALRLVPADDARREDHPP